jgi:hypothetical protein
LEKHLLGGLRGNTTERAARLLQLEQIAELPVLCARLLGVLETPEHLETELLAELGFETAALGVLERDLALGFGDLFDDRHVLKEVDLAGFFAEAGLELARGAEGALGGLQNGGFDGVDQNLLVDPFFFRDLLQDEAKVGFRTGSGGLYGHDGMPLSVSLVFRASRGCVWAGPEARR